MKFRYKDKVIITEGGFSGCKGKIVDVSNERFGSWERSFEIDRYCVKIKSGPTKWFYAASLQLRGK